MAVQWYKWLEFPESFIFLIFGVILEHKILHSYVSEESRVHIIYRLESCSLTAVFHYFCIYPVY